MIGFILCGIGFTLLTISVVRRCREIRRERRAVIVKARMDGEHFALRLIPMNRFEKEAQLRSFAYGNLKIDRPELTREEFDRMLEEKE